MTNTIKKAFKELTQAQQTNVKMLMDSFGASEELAIEKVLGMAKDSKGSSNAKYLDIDETVHNIIKACNIRTQTQEKVKTGTSKEGKDILSIKSRTWNLSPFDSLSISKSDIETKIEEIATNQLRNSSKPKVLEAKHEMTQADKALILSNFYQLVSKLVYTDANMMKDIFQNISAQRVQYKETDIEINQMIIENKESTLDQIERNKLELLTNQCELKSLKLAKLINSGNEIAEIQEMIDSLATPQKVPVQAEAKPSKPKGKGAK